MRGSLRFRMVLLVAASFLGGLASAVVGFTVAWAASRYGAAALGVTLIAGMVPGLVLSFAGGVLADRVDARKLLLLGALSSGTVLSLAAVGHAASPGVVAFVALNLALSVLGSLFGPSAYVLVPALFPEAELIRVNARLSLADDAAHFAGPLLGAGVFAAAGVEGALFSAAAISLAGGLLLLALPPVPRSGADEAMDPGFALAGFEHVVRSPGIRPIVLLFAALNFYAAGFQVAAPLYAAGLGGSGAYASLLAAMSLGMTASNLALSAVPMRSSERLIFGSSLVQGLALVGLGRSRALLAAALFGALNDAMANVSGTVFVAYLQARLPEALLGRVFAAVHTLAMLLTPLGFAAAPWLIEQLGARMAIVALGAGTVAVTALVWLWRGPGRRGGAEASGP